MPSCQNEHLNPKAYLIFLSLITASAWITTLSLFFIPTDAKSAWLLGFSHARWVMIAVAFIIAVFITIYLFRSRSDSIKLKQQLEKISLLTNNSCFLAGYYLALFICLILISVYLANWHFYQHDEYISALFLRSAPFVFLLSFAWISSLFLIPFFKPSLIKDYTALVFFTLIIILIDLFTNTLEAAYMPWDVKYFYLLAERGLEGEKIAPYIYRYATPLLARQIADYYHVSIHQGYTAVAYLGAVSQMFFLYLFLRYFGSSFKAAIMACLMIALCQFNVKYLLFDVSRPEHFAYFWVIITSWAALSSHWLLCGLFALIGLQFREHVAIPPFIMLIEQVKLWWNSHLKSLYFVHIIFLIICLIIGIFVPRIIIQANDSTQFIDPQHPATFFNLIALPLDLKRNINFLYVIAAYLLPILLLATPQRIKIAWAQLKPWHPFIILYSASTILLTLYGGHDLMRYITFLFLPQALLLSRLFEQPIPKTELVIAFLAVLVFNRILWYIPVENFDQNVDFYGGYDNRVNLASLIRWLEIFISILLLISIRLIAKKRFSQTKT